MISLFQSKSYSRKLEHTVGVEIQLFTHFYQKYNATEFLENDLHSFPKRHKGMHTYLKCIYDQCKTFLKDEQTLELGKYE